MRFTVFLLISQAFTFCSVHKISSWLRHISSILPFFLLWKMIPPIICVLASKNAELPWQFGNHWCLHRKHCFIMDCSKEYLRRYSESASGVTLQALLWLCTSKLFHCVYKDTISVWIDSRNAFGIRHDPVQNMPTFRSISLNFLHAVMCCTKVTYSHRMHLYSEEDYIICLGKKPFSEGIPTIEKKSRHKWD